MSYWTGWGSPALIPLHFIGLDGPSYNCIRALPPSIPHSVSIFLHSSDHVTPQHTWKTPGETRRTSTEANFLHSHRQSRTFSLPFLLVKVVKVVMLQTAVLLGWRLNVGGGRWRQELEGRGIWCPCYHRGDLADFFPRSCGSFADAQSCRWTCSWFLVFPCSSCKKRIYTCVLFTISLLHLDGAIGCV